MDSLIKQVCDRKNQRGFALLTILLLILLVTSVILMALNITAIDSNLAATNRRTTQGFHAAESGAELGIAALQNTMEQNGIPAYPAGSGVTVNAANTTGNLAIPDFVEELTSGLGSDADSTTVNPDVTITAVSNQTVQVDIDYEGPMSLAGSEMEELGIGYHKKTGGTGCAAGTLYYIDSTANGPLNSRSQVGSAYFNCF